jgi:hypothetical protein
MTRTLPRTLPARIRITGDDRALLALRAGDLLHRTRATSVQFGKPFSVRLIRVPDRPAYDGWLWPDGGRLDATGDAVARRTVLVRRAGLRRLVVDRPPQPRRTSHLAGVTAPATRTAGASPAADG